jgi:chaperonin GroES
MKGAPRGGGAQGKESTKVSSKTSTMTTTIKPLRDRILVKRLEAEEKTKGGLIIPDTAKEKPQEGKVVAVGTGKIDDNGKKIDLSVKVGDRVLFGSYAGNEVRINGEEYLIMREEEVFGVVEG